MYQYYILITAYYRHCNIVYKNREDVLSDSPDCPGFHGFSMS